jgi:Na+-transporting NADH:ubiquinone oxidoreductase subunit NqrA
MAELDKTVKDVYEAVLATYHTCKDKRQGAKDALAIYEQNLGFVEDDALRESLNAISEQRNKNQVKKQFGSFLFRSYLILGW